MDITYIPMARGFVYLAAVVDWFSRRVLAWRVSITMEVAFCLEAVEEALARHGRPEIFNTDQGSQFTGQDFTGLLLDNAIAISMDGKGAWRDNVFVERLLALGQIRRGSICGPTTASARRALRSAGIWISTTASDRIRALTLGHRITPTSTTCRRSRQHEFANRFRVRHSGRATPSRRATPKTAPRRQPAEVPLYQRENLSRQSRPPLSAPAALAGAG